MGIEDGKERLSQRKISKIITRMQRNGVKEGDPCPRCGRHSMKGNTKDCFVPEVKAYICKDCEMEHSLSVFSRDEDFDDFESWHLYGAGAEFTAPTSNGKVGRQILSVFQPGDRVIDTRSDWPGTIVHTLPEGGLYEVQPDGSSDTSVMKDIDLVFAQDEDLVRYTDLLRNRIKIGSAVKIEVIASNITKDFMGKEGYVTAIEDNGSIRVQCESGSSLSLFPDADRLRFLGEIQSSNNQTQDDDDDDAFVIEF